MNRDKREPEYPAELESQFILRLPEEPAKTLRDVLQTGENLKNRLTIQVDSDVRHGEVRLDHWLMHAKIVDLPTIIESLKTIDNKSFYKTADVCQMMICKDEPDQTTTDEESTSKNKKKDPYKVDKKFLFPHGVTPPTKNVRRRRFRKTLKKKYAEGPEIEKEVKRLLRADNEAISVTWEIVTEDNELEQKVIPSTSKSSKTSMTVKAEKKTKSDRNTKSDAQPKTSTKVSHSETSKVVDIFGGAVSDSEDEDHKPNIPVELEDSHLSAYDSMFDTNSIHGLGDARSKHGERVPIEFDSQMFQPAHTSQASTSQGYSDSLATLELSKSRGLSDDDGDSQQKDVSKDDMTLRIEELKTELEELKQQRQRTQLEMVGMENLALRKRFQDILHTLNQDIMYKDMEYQGLIVMQTSEDI